MHTALRPDGVLLDVHPEPDPSSVEVRGRCGDEPILPLREPTRPDRVRTARAALAELIAAGYFRPRRATSFVFVYHFDSAAAWRAYLAERWRSAEVDERDEARMAAALARSGGEVLIREQVHAAVYDRLRLAGS